MKHPATTPTRPRRYGVPTPPWCPLADRIEREDDLTPTERLKRAEAAMAALDAKTKDPQM